METDFQKGPSQCGLWNGERGIKRRKGGVAPNPPLPIPRFFHPVIMRFSAQEEFPGEFQLL